MKKILLLCLFAGMLLSAQAQVKMMVLSDPHVLDTALYDNQASFSGDPKLVEHSLELFDIALNRIVAAQPDILLIPGDLTKDGELASHQYVANKLNTLSGIQVFVVPGNHDLTNPSAESFLGGNRQKVANVNAAQFRTIYANMGYTGAALYSTDSLSYLAWANDTLAILGLNSAQPNTTSRASAGGLDDATLNFVDSAMAVVRQHGGQVIAMMHHQLVEHFDGEAAVANTYVCNTDTNLFVSRDSAHHRLMQAGVSVMLTGHFHIHSIQRVTPEALELSDTLPTLTDISTGALCSWPSPIRTLVLNGEQLSVSTDTIGTYQTEGMARNANTVRGAINTMAPKIQSKLVPMLKKVMITQASIDKMNMPQNANEMATRMHTFFDEPGLKLLNTLARGEEQLPEHMPEQILQELKDSMQNFFYSIAGLPENYETLYGPTSLIPMNIQPGIIESIPNILNTTILPIFANPILYNYVTIGGLNLDGEDAITDLLLGSITTDTPQDTVPDWNLMVPAIRYEGLDMPTVIFDTERTTDGTQKIMRNGVIYVRKWDKIYTLKGEEIQ